MFFGRGKCPQNVTFALKASLLAQIFTLGKFLRRSHYLSTYQPPEDVYLLNIVQLFGQLIILFYKKPVSQVGYT